MAKSLKRIPLIAWFGGALLAFSFACVLWVMRTHAGEDVNSPPPQPGRTKVAGCYGYVDIEPGVAKLYRPGLVAKVVAHDNDVVEKDAPLVLLDDTEAKNNLARAQTALAVAELDLEKAKFLPVEHAEKIAGQNAAIAAKKVQLEGAEKKHELIQKALTDKSGGAEKSDLYTAEAMVRSLQEAIKGEEATLRGLEKFDPAIDVRRAEKQIAEKQTQVKLAQYALEQCAIKAPSKGTVLRIMVAQGDALGLNPREPAVIFCPDTPRIIRAEVDQEFANRLFLNQTALIRDDSTNTSVIRGKVTRLSDWFSHRRSMVQEPLQFNDVRTLECIITLDANEKIPLRIGQRVRVTMEGAN
jgi:multidrug resistance efflux pump